MLKMATSCTTQGCAGSVAGKCSTEFLICVKKSVNLWRAKGRHRISKSMSHQVSPTVFPSTHFIEKLGIMSTESTQRFTDFKAQKTKYDLFSKPFVVDVEKAAVDVQMELLDLQ